MKEIGKPKTDQAMVLCEDIKCLNNEQLPAFDTRGVRSMARNHESTLPGHKTVVVYADTSHPLSQSQASEVFQLTGVKIPAELVISS